jgi:hypothetical protein
MQPILEKEKLESVLLANWTSYINTQQLIRFTLENIRDAIYPVKEAASYGKPLPQGVRVSVTNVGITDRGLEIWAEFSAAIEVGTVIGTHIFNVDLNGFFKLKETYGTCFS